MKLFKLAVLAFLLLLNHKTYAEDIDLTGVWCGKWDNIYAACFEIMKQDEVYTAIYRWEERLNQGFQKKSLAGELRNANTLDMEGKILIVDLKDHDKAVAVGIFESHSRIATMTRLKKN